MSGNNIKKYFSDITNWKWFVFIAIIVRGPLWLFFGHLVKVNLPPAEQLYSYFVKDDYIYFFGPVDNYMDTGLYSYIPHVPFTGRMPGYSIVYMLFRFIFPQKAAVFCVIGTQFILSAVSVYVLALTVYTIFESKRAFYITFCLYILAIFPGFFDFIIVAESFSVSAMIFTFYFLTRYIKDGYQTKHLIISGLFLAWTIFLREYTGLLLAVFPLTLVLHHLFVRKDSLLKTIKVGILFCLPFILADSVWITRNYMATKEFIPIASPEEKAYGKLYSASWESLDNLVYSWGENSSPFDFTTMGYYFREPFKKLNHNFPSRIFKNITTYNADSLVQLRTLYGTFYSTTDSIVRKNVEAHILASCRKYKEDYIAHNSFSYWVVRPVKDFKYLAIFSGTGYLPLPAYSKCSLFGKLIKLVFTVLYYFIFIFGLLGIIKLFIIKRKPGLLPWLLLLGFLTIVLTIIEIGTLSSFSSIQEPRYFVQSFMMLVPFAAYFADGLLFKRSGSN